MGKRLYGQASELESSYLTRRRKGSETLRMGDRAGTEPAATSWQPSPTHSRFT
jgi:hypothetical protein